MPLSTYRVLIVRKLFACSCNIVRQAGRPDTVSAIPILEGLIIGGDLNGHVGKERGGYEEVMGIYGFGDRNREGEYILDFCLAKGLRIMNTMFKKEREKMITFKSSGRDTQIDYLLVRAEESKMVKDCMTNPGEEVITD